MSSFARSAAVLNAVEENLWSQWSQFGRGPGCTLYESQGALWFDTPISVPPYNLVIRFKGPEDCGALVDRIFAHFADRGVSHNWVLHPNHSPSDLARRLEAKGHANVEPLTGMAMDLSEIPREPPTLPGIEIHEVTPSHDFAPFLEFVAYRWHVPPEAKAHLTAIAKTMRLGEENSPNRAWIAVKDGVALAKMVTHEERGELGPRSVGLYGAATREEARGKGLASLLVIHALQAARARGHKLAVLHSTPMAQECYRRVGFQDVGTFHLFAKPGTFHA